MDIVAHALWAGAGLVMVARRIPVSRRTAFATITLTVLPDLLQLVPLAIWILFGSGTWSALSAYSIASPGTEPALPPAVRMATEHLHCVMHSGIIALAVTAACARWLRRLWLPLAGWWLHILIDVFTHSAAYYPSPVLYPFTMRGVDAIAWNTPTFMVANYAALALLGGWLYRSSHQRRAGP